MGLQPAHTRLAPIQTEIPIHQHDANRVFDCMRKSERDAKATSNSRVDSSLDHPGDGSENLPVNGTEE